MRLTYTEDKTMSAWCGLAVYPRACGGNDVLHVFKGAKAGLSPRVRGNLPVNYEQKEVCLEHLQGDRRQRSRRLFARGQTRFQT